MELPDSFYQKVCLLGRKSGRAPELQFEHYARIGQRLEQLLSLSPAGRSRKRTAKAVDIAESSDALLLEMLNRSVKASLLQVMEGTAATPRARKAALSRLASADATAGHKRFLKTMAAEPFPHYLDSDEPGFVVRIDEDGTRVKGRFVDRVFVEK